MKKQYYKLTQFTIQDIRDLDPCYDPIKYLPEDWKGTVIDILDVKECSEEDRLWVALREEFISEKILRLFAVSCARKALKLVENPDPRSVEACNVAERFAHGEATKEELRTAWEAAEAAWEAAARDAAWDAAGAAARDAQTCLLFDVLDGRVDLKKRATRKLASRSRTNA